MGTTQSVSIIIYNHNGKRYFEKCFATLLTQTLPPHEVIFVDCGSTDDSKEIVRKQFSFFTLIENKTDIDFAAAVNQGIRAAQSPYLLLLNMDTLMTPTFLAEMVKAMEQSPDIGSVSGKLLLVRSDGLKEKIDSTGHIMRANRLSLNRGSGEIDWGQYDSPEQAEIFGVSGTLPLYRKKMLEDIAYEQEYFDESFYAYYEDIDLDLRANLRGWRAVYTPKAIAYHERGGAGYGKIQEIQIHAHKNRYLLILKNDQWQNLLCDALFLFQYELSSFFEILPTKPYLFKAYWLLLKLLPQTLRKRHFIQSHATIQASALRKWFQVEPEDIQSVANTLTSLFFIIVLIKWLGFVPVLLLVIAGYGLVGGGISLLLHKLRPPRKAYKL